MYDTEDFDKELNRLSSIIVNRVELANCFYDYCLKHKKSIVGIFEPYFGRVFKFAYSRGLLPSFLTTKKRPAIYNMIHCEAHLDKLRMNIESSLE